MIFFVFILMSLFLNSEIPRDRNEFTQISLESEIAKGKIPGIQYLVLDSTHVLFEYSGGWADIRNQKPMEPTTTMMAYSMTKTWTAVAILQLVEQGKINLDSSINEYLSNNPYGTGLTIRHLLSQTSGIPNPIPLKWVHLEKEHEHYQEDTELNKILKKYNNLSFDPGKKYAYSNISYWLLGKIIENTTGYTYPDYIRKFIFKPLNISGGEIGFAIPDSEKHAKGYLAKYSLINIFKGFLIEENLVGENEGKWIHIHNHYLNGPAFGGLVTTAFASGKLLQDQLKKSSVLMSSEMKKTLYTQQTNNAGQRIDMTLGWHIGQVDGVIYYYKEGGGGGYHSEMRIYPTQGIGTVIMANKTNFKSRKFLNRMDMNFFPK